MFSCLGRSRTLGGEGERRDRGRESPTFAIPAIAFAPRMHKQPPLPIRNAVSPRPLIPVVSAVASVLRESHESANKRAGQSFSFINAARSTSRRNPSLYIRTSFARRNAHYRWFFSRLSRERRKPVKSELASCTEVSRAIFERDLLLVPAFSDRARNSQISPDLVVYLRAFNVASVSRLWRREHAA